MGTTGTIIPAQYDEYCDVAPLRSEIMKARYGSEPVSEPGPDAFDGESDLSQACDKPIAITEPPKALRCIICSKEIPAERKRLHPRTVTCGDSCAHKRTSQRQKLYNQRLSGKGQAKMTLVNGSSEAPAPEGIQTRSLSQPPQSSSRLVSLINQLACSGLRLRLTIEGTELEITQR
jgi:hypothetical protein